MNGDAANMHLASAVGALHCINQEQIKGHSRIARLSEQLAIELLKDVGARIPRVSSLMIASGEKIFPAISKLCEELSEEAKVKEYIIWLNLVAFNMDELPIFPKHSRKLNHLINCFIGEDVLAYDNVRIAHRVWQRLETEILIDKAENNV
jgi:hypothetical protein